MYDELVERLRAKSYTLEELSIILPKAADAIEELMRRCEQFQYMPLPAWIPVTERLPDDGSDILAYTENGEDARIVPANYDRGIWFDCCFNRVAENITHWMPLPEPPEEGE